MGGVEHYVIDGGDRGVFRWVHPPRRERLVGDIPTIVMSLIHHNYVQGDYHEFDVQLVDLSCEQVVGPRGGGVKSGTVRNPPRFVDLTPPDELMSRDGLNQQANHIYSLLLEIAQEE